MTEIVGIREGFVQGAEVCASFIAVHNATRERDGLPLDDYGLVKRILKKPVLSLASEQARITVALDFHFGRLFHTLEAAATRTR